MFDLTDLEGFERRLRRIEELLERLCPATPHTSRVSIQGAARTEVVYDEMAYYVAHHMTPK